MDAAIATLLGTLLGASATLVGTSVTAWNARKSAGITAENQARMQSEKLRHDALVGEIAFKRAKLEELCKAIERATAYCTLSVAVFRRKLAPTVKQQLERYDEDMAEIRRALRIADLYFDNVSETIAKLLRIIDSSLHNHREYFRNERTHEEDQSALYDPPPQRPEADHLSLWTGMIVGLEHELDQVRAELKQKIAKEVSRLAMDAAPDTKL